MSNYDIPNDILDLYKAFRRKVSLGEAREYKTNCLKGKGYKFDQEEEAQLKFVKKMLLRSYGIESENDILTEKDEEILKNTRIE